MAELSPAAQAVLDAFTEDNSLHDWKHNRFNVEALAAALRAAAEEIILPKYQYADWEMADCIMKGFQAVADELDASDD